MPSFPPFRIGIAFKLFCALLAAGIVMATAMGVASHLSFQRGFLGYLNELENQRVGVLTAEEAISHSLSGPKGLWNWLRRRRIEGCRSVWHTFTGRTLR